jgi:predicted nuclease with TOPRIM domain
MKKITSNGIVYSSDYNSSTYDSCRFTIEYVEDLRSKITQLEERIEVLESESKKLNEIRKRKIEELFLD